MREHVKSTSPDASISLMTYYKPNKLSAQFSTRVRAGSIDRDNVVYQYNCPINECNSCYIGYTAQTLKNRVNQHRYKSSSIWKHLKYDHDADIPSLNDFVGCFEVVFSSCCTRNLKIAEAILIKSKKPDINVKYNELYDFLQLF